MLSPGCAVSGRVRFAVAVYMGRVVVVVVLLVVVLVVVVVLVIEVVDVVLVVVVLVVLLVDVVVVAETHIPPEQEPVQVISMLCAEVPKQYHSSSVVLSAQESYSVSTEIPSSVNSTQLDSSVLIPLS